MKLWRDFKLLALCAGLGLLDAGCQPKDEWNQIGSLQGTFWGTVIGVEQCGKFGSVVFEVGIWNGLPPKDHWSPEIRSVAGLYNGRNYSQLVRIEFQEDGASNGYRRVWARLGGCVMIGVKRGELPRPYCANDNIPVYAPFEALLQRETPCDGTPDPR